MKLLYSLEAIQPEGASKVHGGGKYGEVVFRRMVERGIPFAIYYDSDRWILPEILEICRKNSIEVHDTASKPLAQIVAEGGFDTVYTALPTPAFMALKGCRRIGTLHGLRHLETDETWFDKDYRKSLKSRVLKMVPWLVSRRRIKRHVDYLQGCDKLVVVSDHTKCAVMSYFPELVKDEIKVFYSPNTSPDKPAAKSDGVEPYFLCVSGNRPEKNVLRAIKAFDRLVEAGYLPKMSMKITGCKPSDFKYRIKHPDRFDFYGYVDDAELQQLYADAYAFVYPSVNEGFGYPPLEAMRYGVPVISSPLSSIATILEGGALYFNPLSVEEIMGRMLMIADPACHDRYARLGAARYKEVESRQKADLDALIDYIAAP